MKEPKANIIIVEDEEAQRLSLKAILEEDNYSVSVAENAAVALELVRKQFFDVFLVDYKLSDMNGIDWIKQAAAVSKESMPIVITGFGSLEIAVESMRIGAHDYMVKPINIEDLKKNIESIIVEREDLKRGRANLDQVIKKIENPDENVIVIATPKDADEQNTSTKGILRIVTMVYKYFKTFFWDID